mmetsp:Transcript_7891/g.27981  ORF Transcript_7891/g.27981 Transcript_7891/m.27981 type:complete len:373 (-) Transcript_7891:271-1389(-)
MGVKSPKLRQPSTVVVHQPGPVISGRAAASGHGVRGFACDADGIISHRGLRLYTLASPARPVACGCAPSQASAARLADETTPRSPALDGAGPPRAAAAAHAALEARAVAVVVVLLRVGRCTAVRRARVRGVAGVAQAPRQRAAVRGTAFHLVGVPRETGAPLAPDAVDGRAAAAAVAHLHLRCARARRHVERRSAHQRLHVRGPGRAGARARAAPDGAAAKAAAEVERRRARLTLQVRATAAREAATLRVGTIRLASARRHAPREHHLALALHREAVAGSVSSARDRGVIAHRLEPSRERRPRRRLHLGRKRGSAFRLRQGAEQLSQRARHGDEPSRLRSGVAGRIAYLRPVRRHQHRRRVQIREIFDVETR